MAGVFLKEVDVRPLSSIFGLVLLVSPFVQGENWPHWRGPSRDGISPGRNLPLHWSTTENVTWKLEMPAWSGSTPIIWGEFLFLNVAEGGERVARQRGRQNAPQPAQSGEAASKEAEDFAGRDKELSLWCLDRNTGKVLWKRSLSSGNRQLQKQNMSSPSPVTDGKHVWVMTGTGILKCFDFSGEEIWKRDIQAEYGEFGLNWGYASSPLLFDNTLVIQVLHGMKTDEPSYVLGIDASTGTTRWREERPTDAVWESPDSYTTPALLELNGGFEIVITGGDYVTGHDPSTGKELWRAGGLNPTKARAYRIIASPVVRDDIIYVPSRKDPLLAFRAGGRGDVTRSHLLWQSSEGPDVPTPVTDGRYLYILGDQGVMRCLDANTGETVWGPERVRPGIYSASPVLADGRIYVTSEDGVTSVISDGPEFRLLAENDLQGYTLSSPALSDGQIFLRTEEYLYCIGKRQSSGVQNPPGSDD